MDVKARVDHGSQQVIGSPDVVIDGVTLLLGAVNGVGGGHVIIDSATLLPGAVYVGCWRGRTRTLSGEMGKRWVKERVRRRGGCMRVMRGATKLEDEQRQRSKEREQIGM